MRDLRTVAKSFLPNPRCMAVVGEAEELWGRNTPFDEYTTLHAMCNRSKSHEELAFAAESVLLGLKKIDKKVVFQTCPRERHWSRGLACWPALR